MSLTRSGARTRSGSWALLAAALTVSCGYLGGEGAGAPDSDQPADASATLSAVPSGPLADFIDTIPVVEVRDLDLETALTLVAMPLSCVDRPHAAPRDRSTYLDEIVVARRAGYERNRSFYGCWDWHSAVNSTWAMVRLYKAFPQLPIGGLVTEKLSDHLSKTALEGEQEFFAENVTFERPYGWAWLLMLYAELRGWEHPGAPQWADNLEPLATMFSERMVSWLPHLERPSRSGAHSNTAFSLAMMLEYARAMDDFPLQEAIEEAAVRLFENDLGCPTAYEPWGSDFLSPCLEEAALMAAVLETEEFVAWFDAFMPAVTSREFLPLTTPVDTSADEAEPEEVEGEQPGGIFGAGEERAADAAQAAEETTGQGAGGAAVAEEEPGSERGEERAEADPDREEQRRQDETRRSLASRSHLIGLAFVRADAMNRIAAALPEGDPRIEAYRRLAALHGSIGFDAMFDADYAGSHWIGTFALKYLLTDLGL